MRKLLRLNVALLCSVLLVCLAGWNAANAQGLVKDYQKFAVPLSNTEANSEKISITVLKLSKTSTSGNRPPIFFLSGGPGQSAIRYIERRIMKKSIPRYIETLLEQTTVYFIDQRGVGYSEPALKCPKPVRQTSFEGGDQEAYIQQIHAEAKRCLNSLGNDGRKLDLLNTREASSDLEQIRKNIGADKVVLVGISYGTHLALSYIKQFPNHVDRAILYLVEGLDQTFKLPSQYDVAVQKIDNLRRSDGLPPVIPLIHDFLRRIEETDGNMEYVEKKSGDKSRLKLSTFEARLMLRRHGTFKGLTRLYRILMNRDYSEIQDAVIRARQIRVGPLKYYATDCASHASKRRLQRIKQENRGTILGNAINFPFPHICDALGITPLDDQFRAPAISKAPILAVSGVLDFKTPPGNVEHLKQGFPNLVHVVEAKGHHSVCNRKKCHDLVKQFLEDAIPAEYPNVIYVD